MKKLNYFLLLLPLTLVFVIYGCKKDKVPDPIFEEIVITADRASGNISFIDAELNTVISKLDIPGSEPMYAVYSSNRDKVYVGDRANNKVLIVEPNSRTVESSIDVGNGVFHMWADGNGNQLWVNNDIDFTTSVIDLSNNTVISTINIGVKPHDVFVNKTGTMAYVTVFSGDPNVVDSVFAYSTSSFQRVASAAVGKDPHVFHLNSSNRLYVACQSGTVHVLGGTDLAPVSTIAIPNSHGIFAANNEEYLYVADISNKQLYTVDPSANSTVGSPLTTIHDVPHNLTVNEANNKLFVTHSGMTANTLSIYGLENGSISSQANLTVGNNPFGLVYYKRQINE